MAITGPLAAQDTKTAASSKNVAQSGYSTVDLNVFGGYEWFQFGQGHNASVKRFGSSGVWGGRGTWEFSKYIGAEIGVQNGYNRLKLLPFGAQNFSSAPASNTELYLAAEINATPRESKFRPFFLIGPGYMFYRAPNLNKLQVGAGAPAPILPSAGVTGQDRTALVYGIGLKVNASKRFAVRFDLDGMRSGTPHYGLPGVSGGIPGTLYIPGGDSHESSLTASVGLTFRLRYHEPPPPPAPAPPPPPAPKANVQVGPITGAHDVCPGENVRLSVTASGWLPDQTPAYQWMVNDSAVNGATSSSFSVPTVDGAGAKRITVQVSAGDSKATSAPVTVNVKSLTPPTIS
ncbi:MAG TPA: hypothetical protein VHB50_20480, partial [Bryobacteraceae bacterium]|nr:hypothetical protein [Bryobacteraceae bacterium]